MPRSQVGLVNIKKNKNKKNNGVRFLFYKGGNKQCYSSATIATKKREGPGNRILHSTRKRVVQYTMSDSSQLHEENNDNSNGKEKGEKDPGTDWIGMIYAAIRTPKQKS